MNPCLKALIFCFWLHAKQDAQVHARPHAEANAKACAKERVKAGDTARAWEAAKAGAGEAQRGVYANRTC